MFADKKTGLKCFYMPVDGRKSCMSSLKYEFSYRGSNFLSVDLCRLIFFVYLDCSIMLQPLPHRHMKAQEGSGL